jgi:putative redox protein
MAHVDITWVGEHRYVAVDSSNHSVVLSPPNDIGMKPSEMLLVALATCSGYDVVNIIKKKRITLERMNIHVEAEQASEAPWAYQRIHLTFDVAADKLTQPQLEQAIELSMNQYCSVRATLSPEVQVTFETKLATSESAG